MIGETVSHYRILDRLGEGGMGEVYEAEDLRLGRTVAIKVLQPRFTQDRERRARFEREARAASRLDHPNVGVVYEIGDTDDGALFIAMARYPGGTLRDRLGDGALDVPEARHVAVGLAKGLAAAHRAGVVHRDVKPANIVVTDDGLTKVIDFGIAKLADADPLTQAEAVTGSAHYMAPEQAQAGDVDARADVWAIGVVLYEMLAGRRPFDGAYSAAVLYQVTHETPPPLSDLRPGVPDELAAVVARCLQKDPGARYADAGEVADALSAGTGLYLSPTRHARWRPWALASGLAAFLTAAVALAWGQEERATEELYEKGRLELREYLSASHIESAAAYFRRVLAQDSLHAPAWAGLSESEFYAGRLADDTTRIDSARYYASQATRLAPRRPEGYVAAGLMSRWTKEPRTAVDLFQLAIHLDSTHAGAWRGLGTAYLDIDEPAAAERAFHAAIRHAPGDWGGFNELGHAHYYRGDYAEAEAQWRRAVELSGGNVDSRSHLAAALHELGEVEKAEPLFRQLVSEEPSSYFYTNLGTSLFHQRRFAEAAAQYERALEFDPNDSWVLGFLATTYSQLPRRAAQARALHESASAAIRASPGWSDDDGLTATLASHQAALGERRTAIRLLKEASTPPPSSTVALLALGTAYSRLDLKEEADYWVCAAIRSGQSPKLVTTTPSLQDLRGGAEGWSSCQSIKT